jgi:hypothetical protein
MPSCDDTDSLHSGPQRFSDKLLALCHQHSGSYVPVRDQLRLEQPGCCTVNCKHGKLQSGVWGAEVSQPPLMGL